MEPLEFEQTWRKRFERFAQGETEAAIAGWSETGLVARVHFFKTFGVFKKGSRWLDVGCGAGTYCRLLSEQGIEVIGLDYSFPSLQKAYQQSPALPWVLANAYQLPFQTQQFDGVMCFGVMQALENEAQLVRELSGLIRVQGELWIDGLNRYCLWHRLQILKRKIQKKPKHLHYSNPYQVQKLMKEHGFAQVKLYWAPILPKSLSWLQAWVLSPGMQRLYRWLPWLTGLVSHAFYVYGLKGNAPSQQRRSQS